LATKSKAESASANADLMWSKIDLEKRRTLGRNNTAKALYGYYATHINPTAHNFETLTNLAGIVGKNKKATIIKAHEIMKAVGFLNGYEVISDSIKADVTTKPSPSHHRAIIKKGRKVSKDSNRRNEPTLATEFFTRPKAKK
jgi:hypothetical protein